MTYEVRVDADRHCVLVTHSGEISVAEARAAQQEAIGVLVERGLSRVLVDVTGISNDLASADLFNLTADLGQPGLPRPAAVILAREDQEAKARLIETVALNRGLRIRSFTSRDEALHALADG